MVYSGACEGGAAGVTLKSKEMVVPAQPTPTHPYFLSCFDILWRTNHYNQRVIFYEGGLSGQEGGWDGRAMVERLKSSLAQCLVHYYPWCGRLCRRRGDRLFVDCNDAGVEFVEASLDLPISFLSHQAFQAKPFFEHLCQKVDPSGDGLYSSPLLSVQATLFSDGGLALGVSHSHVVADGQALWSFMVSWGECARGLPLSSPPFLDRRILAVPHISPEKATWDLNTTIKEEDFAAEAQLVPNGDARMETPSLSHDGKQPPPASVGIRPFAQGHKVRTHSFSDGRTPCVFKLGASAVKKLKTEDGGVHTSYEVICAHLWQRVIAAQRPPSSEPTIFVVLANIRNRMNPPLPPTYFGNAIAVGITVTTAGKICSESLHATASRIHEAICETTQESNVVNFMHWLEHHDHDLKSGILPRVPKGKSINVASSTRFPVYEVDFGWGKPEAVRSPKVPGEGELVFFGGHPKSTFGDMEICTRLPNHVLSRLLEDHSFLWKPPCNPFGN